MVHYNFQPQNQHLHQHLILQCRHPSPWTHLWNLPHDITAHHVWPVEARGLVTQPIGMVSQPQPHAILWSLGTGWARRSAPHDVTSPVIGARLRPDCIHEIKTSTLHRPYGMCQSVASVIPDVECPDGGPVWAWGPVVWRRRRYVQANGYLGG